MLDAIDLPGPLGAYAAAFKANDIQRMRQIVLEVVAADEIVLPHPENGVLCHCRSSKRDGMANLLFLSDESGGNRWCLVQVGYFFQFVMTKASIIPITLKPDHILGERLTSSLHAGEYDHYWNMRHDYGGLLASSIRPYHYFYDQLIHLPDIISNMPEDKRVVYIDNTSFLSPQFAWDIPTKPIESDKYYVFPNVVRAIHYSSKHPREFYRLAGRMEKEIVSQIPENKPDPRADLVLWVGITGNKRSWIEQVEGYAQIVRNLSSAFADILVYVDGITAPEGKKVKHVPDTQVAKELKAEIGGKARVVSLVGHDYPTKIAYCKGVDVFIANGGTGCFVPLRVCRKPGLLHSNKSLWTFRGDDYPDTVVFTPPHIVHEVGGGERDRKDFVSYSIAWQEIYNRLLPVLFKVKSVRLEPVPVPEAAGNATQLERSLFQKLSQRLGPRADAADILREVALLFEKKGDFATAFTVMEQAQLQRPDGPLINRKLDEYRAARATASSAPGADTALNRAGFAGGSNS